NDTLASASQEHSMRPLLWSALLCFLAGQSRAADEAKPNTLTSQEVTDGWLLIFDGETTFGWKSNGPVKVESGILTVGATQKARVELTTRFGKCKLVYETRPGPQADWQTVIVPIEQERGQERVTPIDFEVEPGRVAQFRSMKLRPADLRPIYNG